MIQWSRRSQSWGEEGGNRFPNNYLHTGARPIFRNDTQNRNSLHIYLVLSNSTATVLSQALSAVPLLTDPSASSLFQFSHVPSQKVTFLQWKHYCVNPWMRFLMKILWCPFVLMIKFKLLNVVTRSCRIYSLIMTLVSKFTTSLLHSTL